MNRLQFLAGSLYAVAVPGRGLTATRTMTDAQLWQAAWAELALTTNPYCTWRDSGFPASHWSNAKALGDQIGSQCSIVVPPPVVVPPPPSSTFGSRPLSPPLRITGAHDVQLSNKTFRGAGDPFVLELVSCVNVQLADLDFDGAVSGISMGGCSGTIDVGGLRYRNLVGPHANLIQLDGSSMTGRIHDCKGVGGVTADIVSIYKSGGPDAAHPLILEDLQYQGNGWQDPSGSGVMLGDQGGGHIIARRIHLLNPGAVGIGIAGGVDIHVTDNVIYGAKMPGSNIGLYVNNQSGQPSSGHEVARNRIYWLKSDGSLNWAWNAGNCGPIIGWAGAPGTNVWNDTTIDPASLVVTL